MIDIANRNVWESVLRVESPLVHADQKLEVMQRFRREPFLLAGGVLEIPVYSGNSIRGLLRRAAALRICQVMAIPERSLPPDSFYLLFSGGVLRAGSSQQWPTQKIRELRELLPIIALFGASWGSRILPSVLDVWRGVPVCSELAELYPEHPEFVEAPSVFDLLTEVNYTRRDDLADESGEEKSPIQMRYSFEALITGTRLVHGLTLRSANPHVIGCLVDAITTCGVADALGGRHAIGHGQFSWTWDRLGIDHAEAVEGYLAHLTLRGDEIRGVLGVSSRGAQ